MTTTPEFPDLKRPRVTPSLASYPPPSSPDPLPCPRCNSTETKFCYYNNYNLSQPRHFCKNCRRYWTRGGTLRNVPVGGGTRKKPRRSHHHRASPSNSSSSPSSSSLTHETKLTSDSAVEKPDLPSDQTQQQQLQLLNLNHNVGSEAGLSFSSMIMMNSQQPQPQPGYLSLGGYVYGSGYGSGFVHGFQQGYGYGAKAQVLDLPAEIVYGAPVAACGLEMNTWQMAVADHGGQGGGLVDLPEVQILNGGGAFKEEKVAGSLTSSCLDFPPY